MRNLVKITFIALFIFVPHSLLAQDSTYARRIVDTLTSATFWGRGYTKGGMNKAAAFLAAEMRRVGLQPMAGTSYFQNFSFPVNTFPGKMEVKLNGQRLTPGKDFIVSPESKGVKGKGKLIRKDNTHFVDADNRITVSLENKLTWSATTRLADTTSIKISNKAFSNHPATIQVHIQNKFVKKFETANVCAVVKGTERPDSIILFTAHFDHLGGMGSHTFFPGANDNASGISLLLSLAKYYAAHPAPYTIGFICFAGEEAGLIGSKYFAENPLVPLNRIRFLTNVDLVGTGEEGITVVNASEFSWEFLMLNNINAQENFLVKINARGKAANSDHYWFTEKRVPSFFIYTLGGVKAYHDVFDISGTLPMNEYNDLFKLIVAFNTKLMK